MSVLIALACGQPPAGDPSTPPAGTATESEDVSPLGAELVPFPACVPGPTDGRLDVEGACVDGVCIGQTAADASGVYGTAPYCLPLVPGSTSCFYGEFVFASYTDADLDGQPDDGKRAYQIEVFAGWPGGSVDGLSVDISPACWVDALGPPDTASLVAAADGYHAVSLVWDDSYLTVSDQQDADYAFFPDGVVEQVSFQNGVYGP